jgi:hypothetical protein
MNRDKNISNALFELYLSNKETCIKALIHLIPVIWKFDKKVYNARFDNAIKKALEEYETELGQRVWTSVDLNLTNFKMELHFTKRSVHVGNGSAYLPSCYDEERLYIYSKYSTWSETQENKNYHDEKIVGDEYYFWIDSNYNSRIKAEAIVKAIETKVKELKEEIEKLKAEALKVDEYETRMNELKQAMEKLHDEIPYCFTQFFGLTTYATYQ